MTVSSEIVRLFNEDVVYGKRSRASYNCNRKYKKGGKVRLPMDNIDRRRDSSYRSGRVTTYYLEVI